MTAADLTRNLATNKPHSQERAGTTGRFQRVRVARWRTEVGAPVRRGRPPAVTDALGAVGKALLKEGLTVRELCERLGVDRRSWYRYVHRDAEARARVRPYRARRRRANAISGALERQMLQLDRQGLPRVTIAERLGLHVNTVVKYLLRAGRRKTP